uniref:Uncharacterized protein AlNc14C83G5360 n=1 Tax=Albugo laibachii Nc14 TaxID=890382 RepID=F0WFH4_9STRA|nr:conserved hypothetical protein [Albugo laibachii Nc14]|eukprot:CCA19956.1 conserved hypothetical protein [Albugo laibachii Nc14]
MNSCTLGAIFYILKEYPLQHQYIVVKVCKILGGDPDLCITPYLQPERYFGTTERHKLLDRTNETTKRLGRYRQTFAWGATSLTLESRKRIVLYRQRSGLSDEQRLLQIPDAAKAALRQKIIPSVCEIKIEEIDNDAFHKTDILSSSGIVSSQDPIASSQYESTSGSASRDEYPLHLIREVQPFCHPSLTQQYGLTGSGKVASSELNALYFYPIQIERCNYRNVAVRVQLLTSELDFIPAFEDWNANTGSILLSFYGDDCMEPFAISSVNYHQKNPQFDDEIKIALPKTLDSSHHLFFTFYHVHCKKIAESHAQQDLVGYSVLPLMDPCGRIVQDSLHTLSITTTVSSRNTVDTEPFELPKGYMRSFKDTLIPTNNKLPAFTCKSRVLSSTYSQDTHISTILNPLQQAVRKNVPYQRTEADCISDIKGLFGTPAAEVCFFLLPLAKVLIGYICFGPSETSRTAFYSLLILFEKVCTSIKRDQNSSEYDTILHDYVQYAFDDREVLNPLNPNRNSRARVYRALLLKWRDVLREKKQEADQSNSRNLCLAHAHILLKIVVKSMAINLLKDVSGNTVAVATLPSYLHFDDEKLVIDVLVELINTLSEPSHFDLLLQQELNNSIAHFCRALFFIVQPELPSRIICIYMLKICFSHVLSVTAIHVLLPFCKCVMEFELFVPINGFDSIHLIQDRRSYGWLAQSLFSALIFIVQSCEDDRIQLAALKVLRHMFVLNTFDSLYQTMDDQERIALMYIPALTSLVPLKSANHSLFDSDANSNEALEMQKELSVSIAHLISSLSDRCLSFILRPTSFVTKDLSVVAHGRKDTQNSITQSLTFDFGWLHCFMVTLRNLIKNFLVNVNPSFFTLLSPDMKPSSRLKPLVVSRARSKTSAAMSTENTHPLQRRGGRPRQANRLSSPMLLQRPANEFSPSDELNSNSITNTTNYYPNSPSINQGPKNVSFYHGNIDEPSPNAPEDQSVDTMVRRLQVQIAENVLRSLNKITEEFQRYLRSRRNTECNETASLSAYNKSISTSKRPDDRHVQDTLMELTDLHFLLLSHSVQLETLCSCPSAPDDVTDKNSRPILFVVQFCQSLLSYIKQFANNVFGHQLNQLTHFQTRDRLKLLLRMIAFSNEISIKQCASVLLCKIFHASFEEQGTFHSVRETILEIFHEVYYGWESSSSSRWVLVPEYLRDIIQKLRSCLNADASNPLDVSFAVQKPFPFHFGKALDTLENQVLVYFKWKGALDILKSSSAVLFDYEELEEDLYSVMTSISSISMIDEKLFWLDALVRLHTARKNFAEAAYCKCFAAEYCLQSAQVQTGLAKNRYASELEKAMEYVERAGWDSKKIEIWENMLRHARKCATCSEQFGHISQILEHVPLKPTLCDIQQLDFCLYRVSVLLDSRLGCSHPLGLAEYIYKRNIFTSLGEFVNEIKAILKEKTSVSTSIELVPEGKSLPEIPKPETIYFRTNVLKPVGKYVDHCRQFEYATPFTFSGTAYGNVSDQMKRIIRLTVGNSFPYFLTRQTVTDRQEYICCPIENAIVDIAKRNAALQLEIDKERNGSTESKTLSLILKGSVDPEVHGGIPEVIRSFFGCESAGGDAREKMINREANLPHLLDSTGNCMDSDLSIIKQLELADIILCFLQKCQQCLQISRKTCRKSASVTSASFQTPLSPSFQRIHENMFPSSPTSNEHRHSTQGVPAALNAMTSFLGITSGSPSGGSPIDALEQLQFEFEKSFETLLVLAREIIVPAFFNRKEYERIQKSVQALQTIWQEDSNTS